MDNSGSIIKAQRRSLALDALRGYAILTMVLAAFVPATLPGWMHHAQVPPPDFKFNPNLPGITWVDLVFPFFLFSMGAAFPLALSRRIEKGIPYWKIVLGIFTRWFLLIGFALYVEHTSPYIMGYSSIVNNLLCILAFGLVFMVLWRQPVSWNRWLQWSIKAAGLAGAIAFVVLTKHVDAIADQTHNPGFNWDRVDCIIQILANVSVYGGLIWLISRRNLLVRLGSLGVLMAFRLSSPSAGWVNWFYGMVDKIPHSYGLGVAQYLHIVIPATIVGDIILKWMKSKEETFGGIKPWNRARVISILGLMLAFIIVMLAGLYSRWLWQTTIAGLVMCVLGWLLLRVPSNTTEKLLKDFYSWGVYWLLLGLAFEPYEGGIKKDSPTMSYYYVTAGLAIFVLIAFTIIIDILKKQRWLQLLIDNGQNPMIAYIGRGTLIVPLLGLSSIDYLLGKCLVGPWPGFIHALISTLVVALVVSIFTKMKIFWRT